MVFTDVIVCKVNARIAQLVEHITDTDGVLGSNPSARTLILLHNSDMEQNKSLYAGFWLRLVAFIIDRLILGVVGYALGFALGFVYASVSGGANGSQILGYAITIVFTWLYYAGFESSKYQATFGKRIVGIYVTDMVSNRISFGTATARHFSKIISWATLTIGFLMILWTPKRQGLHDKIAKTLVVKRVTK